MQSVSSGIWTRVAVSISYDDNRYTTGTSTYLLIFTKFILNTKVNILMDFLKKAIKKIQ